MHESISMSDASGRIPSEDASALGGGAEEAAQRRARMLAAIAATPAPTRPEGRRRSLVLAAASAALALGIFESAGGMGHAAGRPMTITLAIAGGWGLITALISGALLWRGRSMLGRSPAVLLGGALFIPVALTIWMHLFAGTYAEPFPRLGLRCLGYTLAMSALPMLSFLRLRRGVEPRGPWALGAAIGACCGASTGVLVDLWCPLTNMPHVLVGHVLPIVLLIGIGTALGTRMLGVRATPADHGPGERIS
jgi:hypothetical protein